MDESKARGLIGRRYYYMCNKILDAYRRRNYVTESALVINVRGLGEPIACYLCIKRIEEKHPKFDINGSQIRTHTKCIDSLVGR